MSNPYPGQGGQPQQPFGSGPQQPGGGQQHPGGGQQYPAGGGQQPPGGSSWGSPQQPGQQGQGGWGGQQSGQQPPPPPQTPGGIPSAPPPPPGGAQQYPGQQPIGQQSPGGYQQSEQLPPGQTPWAANQQAGQGGPGGPQAPAKKSKLPKILLFAGIGVVVLALIIGGGLFWNHQKKLEAERLAQEEHDRQVQTAGETVNGFFEALKAGDVEKALGYSSAPPEGESPLLAPEVAKKAAEAAPVEALKVEPAVVTQDANGAYTGATVKSTYTIDGKDVEKEWKLTKAGEDWKLGKVTSAVQFGSTDLAITVNGAKITDSKAEALPGKYTVTTDNTNFEFKSKSFTVTEPEKDVSWIADATPTDAALKTVAATVKASLSSCLKKKELSPDNCPNRFKAPAGVKVDTNTIKFGVTNDPFADAKMRHQSGNVFQVQLTFVFSISAKGKKGDSDVTLSGKGDKKTWVATVDLGSKDVRWTYTGS